MTIIISNILHENQVEIDDSIQVSDPIIQTNGVLQGDPLSLLFNIATADIAESMPTENTQVYVYADDMVITATSRQELQDALKNLTTWARDNELEMNLQKTAAMVFRKGGRLSTKDTLYLENRPISITNNLKYLGITLHTTGGTFTQHVKEKVIAAISAMQDIQKIQHSIDTAISLFKVKITPIVTYGLELIWESLNRKNLKDLENIKATFLKRILCVSKFSPSRLAYALARESFYLEDLRYTSGLMLPSTPAYQSVIQELHDKKNQIWNDFYSTTAMMSTEWRRASYELRHTVTRFAVHGFHHKICQSRSYHQPDVNCVCVLCGKVCDRYHAYWCSKRTVSITEFCKE